MNKVAIITDTHFGVHSGSPLFLESQMKFFKEQFVPYLKENGIKDIIHLGDFYDNRNSINVLVKTEVYKLFEEYLKDFNITILVGNHDSFFKTTISVNSLKFLKQFPNVTLVEDVELHKFNGRDILLVPWQVDNEEFRQRVANKQTDCEVLMGHLEIQGFKFNNKAVCEHGLKTDMFMNNFKLVFSGHFHTRSSIKRKDQVIQYIGNPYHLTRHDIDDDRGFCVLNTDTLEYEFINNNVSIRYVKLTYPDAIEPEKIAGNIVDVYINQTKDVNDIDIEKYFRQLEKIGTATPPKPKIINEEVETEIKDIKFQETIDMIQEYINSLEDVENKKEIFSKIQDLYEECKKDL